MAAEHWFRWHHGTVTDPKWRIVAKRASHALSRNVTVGHVVAVWAAMMENASQASPRGELSGWCDEDIAVVFDMDEPEVRAIREAMQGKTLDGGVLSAWNRRQIKRVDETAAERKRAQRDREKGKQNSVTLRDTSESHTASRNVTVETETETDKKKLSIAQQAARPKSNRADRFPEFWTVYPVKKGRAIAEAKWRARGYDAIADRIIEDVKRRIASDRQWLDGYAPHGSTYINGRGWEDEIEPARSSAAETPSYAVGAL